MGFLSELIFEIAVEGFIEYLGRTLPPKTVNTIIKTILYVLIAFFSLLLTLSLLFVIVMIRSEELIYKLIGWFTMIIPVALAAAIIVFAIIIYKRSKINKI